MLAKNLKTVLMPLAMLTGGLLHNVVGGWGFLMPWLIFAMLFVPFCGVRFGELRVTGLHVQLLVYQAVTCVLVYAAASFFDPVVAQGAMICVLAPTASAAVVVAAMLGARVTTMLTYSLLVNVAVAVAAPLLFAIVVPATEMPFWSSVWRIFVRVIPVVVLPFGAALVLRRVAPRVADGVRRLSSVSFYLWIFALAIVTGRVVNFLYGSEIGVVEGLILAGVSLAICLSQFFVGRFIGGRYGDRAAGGQALGQKNTILAIWLTQSYLHPAAAIAPAAYILWQTIFNSTQLWLRGRD